MTIARIFLSDDDEPTRTALRLALERAGYSVLEAADGREGLRLFRTEPTEIVIADILMSELDGLETIMALRKEIPQVKIIAITGGGQNGRLDFLYVAERLGAHYTFHKPFELRELLAAVHALLQR